MSAIQSLRHGPVKSPNVRAVVTQKSSVNPNLLGARYLPNDGINNKLQNQKSSFGSGLISPTNQTVNRNSNYQPVSMTRTRDRKTH